MLRGGWRGSLRRSHLALLDHMHHLDTCQHDASAAEIFEAQHRLDDAFDRLVVLLDQFHTMNSIPSP